MSQQLTDDEFAAQFTEFRETAWHLETRAVYRIDEEQDAFARFLAGEAVGLDWFQPWLDQIRDLTDRGRRIGRVRLMENPPTDYQRFELWGTPYNVAAGEQVGTLPAADQHRLRLPEHDFWLFDAERVIVCHFTDEGRVAGHELFVDPETVDAHRRWWDIAVANAVPYRVEDVGV